MYRNTTKNVFPTATLSFLAWVDNTGHLIMKHDSDKEIYVKYVEKDIIFVWKTSRALDYFKAYHSIK